MSPPFQSLLQNKILAIFWFIFHPWFEKLLLHCRGCTHLQDFALPSSDLVAMSSTETVACSDAFELISLSSSNPEVILILVMATNYGAVERCKLVMELPHHTPAVAQGKQDENSVAEVPQASGHAGATTIYIAELPFLSSGSPCGECFQIFSELYAETCF